MQNEIFDKINSLPILDVLKAAGISCKKSTSPHQYFALKSDGKVDGSFAVHTEKNIATNFGGNGEAGGPFDVIGKLIGVDPKEKVGMATTIKWFKDKQLVPNEKFTKKFTKSLTDKQILKKFSDLQFGGYQDCMSRWLLKRGVSYTFIQQNHLLIGEVFKDFGYYDSYYTSELEGKVEGDDPKQVEVILFPCYELTSDLKRELVGLKVRRVDGRTIRGKKSHAIGHTGLLWDFVGTSTAMIVEGECDYVILKLMGYKSVVSNNGGVMSHREKIKSLCYETDKVVCLYDDDKAGQKGKEKLSEEMGRQIYGVKLPVRKDNKGNKLNDINDYYVAGYNTKTKWTKIFKDLIPIGVDVIGDAQKKNLYRFVYLSGPIHYYDREQNVVVTKEKIGDHTGFNGQKVFEMRQSGKIEEYTDVCYQYGGKEGYFNSMRTHNMLIDPDGADPILSRGINKLIQNFCGYKEENIEWMHKAILYKITHINDVRVPAVISHGEGGSGKGTLITLLSRIFGQENTQQGLGQKDLVSSFDSYTGGKIILEFREISSGNTMADKIVLDRLKGIIFESRIHINPKFQPAREVDNIAWVHMSSNHGIPIQLDGKAEGNRRFTIIETGPKLSEADAEMIYKDMADDNIVKQYVAWLHEQFPEVPKMRAFPALDNADKRSLVDRCEETGVKIFQWIEEKWPHIYKISGPQFKILVDLYRYNVGHTDLRDRRYDIANLNRGIGQHTYKQAKVRIGDKTPRGYFIKKNAAQKKVLPYGHPGNFTDEEWNEVLRSDGITF